MLLTRGSYVCEAGGTDGADRTESVDVMARIGVEATDFEAEPFCMVGQSELLGHDPQVSCALVAGS